MNPRIRLSSAKVEVRVEVKAELGNTKLKSNVVNISNLNAILMIFLLC